MKKTVSFAHLQNVDVVGVFAFPADAGRTGATARKQNCKISKINKQLPLAPQIKSVCEYKFTLPQLCSHLNRSYLFP